MPTAPDPHWTVSASDAERLRAQHDPLTSTEGLPPLPRRLIAAKLRDDARVALQDAPRKLRGLADDDAEHFVGLEHDGLGGAVLVGPDEFRRWADAIEALLR